MPRDILALLVIVLGIFPAFLSLFFPGLIGLGESPFEFVNAQYRLVRTGTGEHDNYFEYAAPRDPSATLKEIMTVGKPLNLETLSKPSPDQGGSGAAESVGAPSLTAPAMNHVLSYREGVIAIGPPAGSGTTGAAVILASPRQAQILYGRHVHIHLSTYRTVSWRSGRVFRGGSFMGGK